MNITTAIKTLEGVDCAALTGLALNAAAVIIQSNCDPTVLTDVADLVRQIANYREAPSPIAAKFVNNCAAKVVDSYYRNNA